ncbi:hypothetical protein PUN28_003303 [Cardiocondyla obscurior]|uniref:Uncharacterized protein n=1 Tax=Cardiocondyla obscurior TaxID=286306 RepID=A0AAW2GM42_9HYME
MFIGHLLYGVYSSLRCTTVFDGIPRCSTMEYRQYLRPTLKPRNDLHPVSWTIPDKLVFIMKSPSKLRNCDIAKFRLQALNRLDILTINILKGNATSVHKKKKLCRRVKNATWKRRSFLHDASLEFYANARVVELLEKGNFFI